MDKQMIEEMAKCKSCYERFGKCYVKDRATCTDWTRAANQYEQGYRLISENEVVVSRAEYNDLKGLEKHFDDYLIKEIVATRKEMVETFATKLENRLDNVDIILHEDNGDKYLSFSEVVELIHEICKEITEVK